MFGIQRLAGLFRRPSKPIETAGYKPPPYHTWGRYPRDLPPFTHFTVQLMQFDPTIKLGLAMRAAPMLGLEWAYQNDSGEWQTGVQASDPRVAQFVLRQLKRIWQDLGAVIGAQVWGWSGGEVTFRRTAEGLVEVDRLLPRHSSDIRAMAAESQLCGIRVLRCPESPGGYVDLEFPKCWWHCYRAENGQFYGMSAMIGAYSPWFDKWMNGGALDVRRLFMHKDAYAGADITYPEGTTYIPGKGEIPNRDIAAELVEQIAAGATTARPAAYDAQGHELWQLTRASVSSSPDHILRYPRDLDTEILRGMECPDDILTADESSSGAWAGKRVPMAAFFSGLDLWATTLVRDMDDQVIRPTVKINFGDVEYHVCHKPLAIQAAEQQQKQGDKSGGDTGDLSGLFTQSGPPGPSGSSSGASRATGSPSSPGAAPPSRMALDLAVGRGMLDATALVHAAQRIIRLRTGGAERLRGGEADGRPDSDFDPEALAEGITHEREHSSDQEAAKEIAKDHLAEDPEYYGKLKQAGLSDVESAVADWKPPSDAQKESGNYRKPRVKLHGIEVAIENPRGTKRRPEWKPLAHHYGYVSKMHSQAAPEARDGDKVDVFIGPNPESEIVYVVDQEKPGGQYDEPKVMLGFTNEEAARQGYLDNYHDGWHCGPITALTVGQFKHWLQNGDTSKRIEDQAPQTLALRMAGGSSWVPYRGKLGGTGWRSTRTNRVVYKKDRPGDHEHEGPSHVENDGSKTGPHGPVFENFWHDSKGAVEKLMELRSGEALGALHHPKIGDIDLIWGTTGDDRGGARGLAHIIADHRPDAFRLQEVLDATQIKEQSAREVTLESKKFKAIIRLDWDGKEKRWLLTAFTK